ISTGRTGRQLVIDSPLHLPVIQFRASDTNLFHGPVERRSDVLLAEKTSLITGGGRGIGRGIIEQFLAVGADVVIVRRREIEGDLAENPRVIHLAADLGELTQLPYVVEQTASHFGGLDVLVNIGGVMWERSIIVITPDERD